MRHPSTKGGGLRTTNKKGRNVVKHIAGSFYYIRNTEEMRKAYEHYCNGNEKSFLQEYPEQYPCVVSFTSGHHGLVWADYQTHEHIHLTPEAG